MKYLIPLFILMLALSFASCRKCTTCTAKDIHSDEVKFEEVSCAIGPLLDDWKQGIKTAYPEPQYNTVCK